MNHALATIPSRLHNSPRKLRFFASGATGILAVLLGGAVLRPAESRAAGGLTQQTALVVRVIDDASRQPLLNAEVINLSSGQNRFTDEHGEAQLPWPTDGALRLRVRQIGFQFSERELVRSTAKAQSIDTVVFALHAVTYTLPTVATEATNRCGADVDSSSRELSALVLQQLRLGAERYDAFRRAYPFQVHVERRTATRDYYGKLKLARVATEETNSDEWGDRYAPGRIVEYGSNGGFSVSILFLSSLADPVFWTHHCFIARGVESLDGARVIRLDFAPTPDLKAPDWEGSAFVDSATSILHRVQFNLAGLIQDELPRRLTGYTTFTSPTPFIAMPDSTLAMWWRRAPASDGQWGLPDVVQLVHVQRLKYRKATPTNIGNSAPANNTNK